MQTATIIFSLNIWWSDIIINDGRYWEEVPNGKQHRSEHLEEVPNGKQHWSKH